jgi:hypothetical protein
MTRFVRASVLIVFAAVLVAGLPAPAAAQGMLGVGARFSFLGGDATTTPVTPSENLLGVLVRVNASPRVAIEGSIDYNSTTSTDMTQRVTDVPLQGTLLLFLVRSTISPYLLAGIGSYSETTDTLNATTGTVTATSSTRQTGWHAGFGGELAFGKKRHVAAFADYRYRNVQLGNGGTNVIPGTSLLQISHQASMWTGGFVFYF